jgi:hypothetical protein
MRNNDPLPPLLNNKRWQRESESGSRTQIQGTLCGGEFEKWAMASEKNTRVGSGKRKPRNPLKEV